MLLSWAGKYNAFLLRYLFNIYGNKGRDGTVAKPFDAVSKYIHLAIYYYQADLPHSFIRSYPLRNIPMTFKSW
jgi:hypothetical protein